MKTGTYGEKLARKYLIDKGYSIAAENYCFDRAEIDIIGIDEAKKMLIFVEVKTRNNKKFGEPEDAVNTRKKKQIYKSANGFMMEHPEYDGYDMRLDIVSIFFEDKIPLINHFENAF